MITWTRQELRDEFSDESDRLFDSAYWQLRTWIRHGAIDDPDLDDAVNWIEQIIAEKVNNPRSSFYIHGR